MMGRAAGGAWNADPVKVRKDVTGVLESRPRVTTSSRKLPSARVKISGRLPMGSRSTTPSSKRKPKADARSRALPPKGRWSAIKSNDPPPVTQALSASISAAEKADVAGSDQFFTSAAGRALEITSTLKEERLSAVKPDLE